MQWGARAKLADEQDGEGLAKEEEGEEEGEEEAEK